MIYAPSQYYDGDDIVTGTRIDGQWRLEQQQLTPLEACESLTDDGKEIRKEFAQYFSNEEFLDWASKYY